MKKVLLIILLVINLSFLYSNDNAKKAREYGKTASILRKKFDYINALKNYRLAVEYTKKIKNPNKLEFSKILYWTGFCAYQTGEYDEALMFFKESLELCEEIGNDKSVAILYNNIAIIYSDKAEYDNALIYYNKALKYHKEKKDYTNSAAALNNIGKIYYSISDYEKALEHYTAAFDENKKAKSINLKNQAIFLGNIGGIYRIYGNYNLALEYYNQALEINKKLKQKIAYADNLNSIGLICNDMGQYKEAVKYFEKSLKIYTNSGNKAETAVLLNNLGHSYFYNNDLEMALKYYKESLKINKEINLVREISLNLLSLGVISFNKNNYDEALGYYNEAIAIAEYTGNKEIYSACLISKGVIFKYQKKYEKAVEAFTEALNISKDAGNNFKIISCLKQIGLVHYYQFDYKNAEKYFTNAINYLEKIKDSIDARNKIDFLSEMSLSYNKLIAVYLEQNKIEKAVKILESSKAEYLVERIKLKQKNKSDFNNIKDIQNTLDSDTAVIYYININEVKGFQILITSSKVIVKSINLYELGFDNISDIKITEKNDYNRGLKKKNQLEEYILEDRNNNFKDLIYSCRGLMAKNYNNDSLSDLSKLLYNVLFSNIEDEIKDKKNLIIIPDFVLYYLPFEILISQDENKFLVEKYNIKYVQSLTLLKLLKERDYSNLKRSDVLAFGGIEHEVSENADIKPINFSSNTYEEIINNKNVYYNLGIKEWTYLPGTLIEVNKLKEIYPDSKIITGKDADESKIKSMSGLGQLKKYKILHFATHGLSFNDYPELSTLVMSHSKIDIENGYLQVNEIADLNINADFVNLSACETGLGKLYNGEGMLGLTQSFLIAGANSLSVSLWPIADKSSMLYMSELYRLIEEEKLDFYQANSEVKRRFITGEISNGSYSSPFFWAPFVYYGR